MNIRTLIGVATLATSGLAMAQSGEVTLEQTRAGAPGSPALSRAEVLADLAVWRQAGLDRFQADSADHSGTAYETALAEYQRLRNGPAYAAELDRLQGSTRSASADGAAQSN